MPKKKTKKKEVELDPVLSPSVSLSYSYPYDDGDYDCFENESFEVGIIELKVKFFWRYIKLRLSVGKDKDA